MGDTVQEIAKSAVEAVEEAVGADDVEAQIEALHEKAEDLSDLSKSDAVTPAEAHRLRKAATVLVRLAARKRSQVEAAE